MRKLYITMENNFLKSKTIWFFESTYNFKSVNVNINLDFHVFLKSYMDERNKHNR